MESRLVFGDTTRSRLRELLQDRDPKNVDSYRYLGKSYTDFQRHFLATTPYVESRQLKIDVTGEGGGHNNSDSLIPPSFSQAAVNEVIDKALKIPKDRAHRSIVTFVKGSEQPNVQYMPARLTKQGQALLPPSLTFMVPACAKNSMQRLNSGYIIDVTTTVKHTVVDNTPKVAQKSLTQDPFVLMPRFLCDNPSVVPLPVLVDQSDKNVYFLILYNPLGVACTVTVLFYSFTYEQDVLSAIRMVDPTDKTVIVKPKNANDFACGVYNLKAKVIFDKLVRNDNDNMMLVAPLFDASKERAMPTGAHILFERQNFFFSPRRRNWFAERLLVTPGFFAEDGSVFLRPYVHKDSVYTNNTHCVSLLVRRTTLYSVQDTLNVSHVIVNGGFANLRHYKEVNENMRKISHLINSLITDYQEVSYFKRVCPQYADLDLQLLKDYECVLTEGSFFDKLTKLLRTSSKDERTCEEQLFNIRQKRTKSTRLYAYMAAIYEYILSEQSASLQPPAEDSATNTVAISSSNDTNNVIDGDESSSGNITTTNASATFPPTKVVNDNDDNGDNRDDCNKTTCKRVFGDQTSTSSQKKPPPSIHATQTNSKGGKDEDNGGSSGGGRDNDNDDDRDDSFRCTLAKRKKSSCEKEKQSTTLESSMPAGTIEDAVTDIDDKSEKEKQFTTLESNVPAGSIEEDIADTQDENNKNVINTNKDGDYERTGCNAAT